MPKSEAVVQEERMVVIVDDQPKVLEVALRLVQRLGYRTKGFAAARDALAYVTAAKPGQVLCVLTDQTMPEMSGLELARAVQDHDPFLPVAVMSGFSSESIGTMQKDLINIKAVLRKPLVRQDVAMMLKNCLQRGQDKAGQTG